MAQRRLTSPETRKRIQDEKFLKEKHKGKRPNQITDADVLEWARQKMFTELGIKE